MAGNSNEWQEEFAIRVPKLVASSKNRKFSLLKFNAGSDVDVTQWTSESVQFLREDNESVYSRVDNQPSSGVGSEFGKQLREESRRKKMGFSTTKYSKEKQPWLLTLNPDSSKRKRYKGIKEGGVSQNADYWVFVKGGDGILDAYPVDEWYNFMPIGRYQTMDVDEAEEKFSKRNHILNQFALKIKQQLGTASTESENATSGTGKKREDEDDDPTKPKKQKEPKNSAGGSTKKRGGKQAKKNKKQKKERKMKEGEEGEDFIASADSDDGDVEGREVDYMSDSDLSASSDEEPEDVKVRQALVGVDEEDGMKKLIGSDNEDDEEDEDDEQNNNNNNNKNNGLRQNEDEDSRSSKTKTFDQMIKSDSMPTIGADNGDSDSGSDSDDPDEDMKSPFFMQELKPLSGRVDILAKDKAENSRDGSSPYGKRKNGAGEEYGGLPSSSSKKIKLDSEKPAEQIGMTEEMVRRYLQRKPQSSKELVARFKPQCPNMTKAEVVTLLAEILKRLEPDQIERNGTMYFSCK